MRILYLCIYRPPTGSFDVFSSSLSAMLGFLSKRYQSYQIVLCGDLNVDVNDRSANSRVLCDIFGSFNLIGDSSKLHVS